MHIWLTRHDSDPVLSITSVLLFIAFIDQITVFLNCVNNLLHNKPEIAGFLLGFCSQDKNIVAVGTSTRGSASKISDHWQAYNFSNLSCVCVRHSRRFAASGAMTPEEREQRILYTNVLEYEQDHVSLNAIKKRWQV